MIKTLVVDGMSYGRPVETFGDLTGNVDNFMKDPAQFNLVLFTGGADVSPELYKHTSPKGECFCNKPRDMREIAIFEKALEHGIKMTGICRGFQFLNVMAGGYMVHHLDGHTGSTHDMATSRNEKLRVNSLHHQMAVLPTNACLIGWSGERRSGVYIGDKDEPMSAPEYEVEAAIFPEINAAGVQYHPEMMPRDSAGFRWYEELVEALLAAETMEEMVSFYTEGTEKCLCGTYAG
jgi:gamma-glutamyl-gamma-aminobutyrate hydrolase PuuD